MFNRNRILIGTSIGLAFIIFFLVTASKPNTEWSSAWWLKPMLVVPLAGALGAIAFSLLISIKTNAGWKKIALYLMAGLVFIIAIWMGMVVGLDGTYWN
ncbi:MAG: hypothetical protein RL115_782 [Bacteroidota bacterium]|jgi:branched-subunit amino acid transport protein